MKKEEIIVYEARHVFDVLQVDEFRQNVNIFVQYDEIIKMNEITEMCIASDKTN